MGSGKGAEHQAEEADADLGISSVARWADCDLSAGLVRLPRDDRKLGFGIGQEQQQQLFHILLL
jgi:hypothetical protein